MEDFERESVVLVQMSNKLKQLGFQVRKFAMLLAECIRLHLPQLHNIAVKSFTQENANIAKLFLRFESAITVIINSASAYSITLPTKIEDKASLKTP